MCAPSSRKAKRDWKRMLHKSARIQNRRITTEAMRQDRDM
jgi:hypothetical protein